MIDILETKHEGCGGIFREINIHEDIQCNKCHKPSERYFYTKDETIYRQKTEISRLNDKIYGLEKKISRINELSS